MKEIKLFQTNTNEWISNHDLLRAMELADAHKSKILYIHTGLSFGVPNPALQKNEHVGNPSSIILELEVPTICVPTFTFSFCNGEVFDPERSKSKMGY